ncbi:Predicted O-methyltransferase YrrM [Prauserella marina]|uniref:Predicted O-methyltransferase YrrM n=1 Tax=Prauserella marina TaxID=530584 RepID=A0A1G6MIN7_9PSEU|nr:O-methyltransferase [Prauserella marina]PWV85436.1 putative O-methyltransferase YrrM [Prauserella marina]SDC54856.1 Predicted O-methyltransferase YrrM [Prauserella marina]
MINTPLPIVPQDSTDPKEVFATALARAVELPPRLATVMTEIETVANNEGIPVIGRLEGTIVQTLATLRGERATRVLELGTAIGYSALWLAHALPEGGKVTSIELDPERAARAADFIDRAGFADRVEIIVGDVFELLPNLGVYDLIFQDVMKHRYFGGDPALATELLRLTKSHLEADGVLMIDNAFCGGGVVAGDIGEPSNELAGVRRMNEVLASDPDFASVIVPVRDGLWVAHRKS